MARADIMAGRAYVSLYVKQSALMRGLKLAKDRLNAFGSEMMAMGRSMATASVAGLAPVAMGARIFASFDDAMRMVKAVTKSTEEDFRMLSNTAKTLGATTSFTAVEVASLMTELGRAGFTATQIDAMTSSVMNLARATGTDAALSAGIMSSSIRQFGLEATDAARVADVLTAAANSTFNTVEGLGESLKYAGPVAKELGMSLEDTVAILGTFGNVGIQGSEAGTALRRLGVITAATGKELKATFGISNVDAAGNLKPVVQIMDEIGQSVESLPIAERVEKMNQAFGLLGITSASVLSGSASDTVNLAEQLRGAAGAAEQAAKEMDAGIGGSFRIIMSAAEGVFLAIGEAISEPLKKATEFGSSFLSIVTKLIGENKEAIVVYAKVAAVVGAIGFSVLGLGLAFSAISVAIGGFAGAVAFAASAISGIGTVVAFIVSPVGLLSAALIGGVVAWANFSESGQTAVATLSSVATDTFGKMYTTFTDTFGGIVEAIKAGDLALAGQIAMTGLRLVFVQGLEAIHSLFGDTMGTIVGQILSGDIAGAWSTAGSAILNTWSQVMNGLVGMVTSATKSITSTWREAVDGLTNYLLQQIGGSDVLSAAFEAISGVNLKDEIERNKKLNEGLNRTQHGNGNDDGIFGEIANGTYQDPAVAAIEQKISAIIDDINAGSQSIVDATQGGLDASTDGQAAAVSAEVKRLQDELAAMRQQTGDSVKAMNAEKPGTPEADGAGPGAGKSGGSGRASAASFSLASLAQMTDGGRTDREERLRRKQLEKADKQLEKTDELIGAVRGLVQVHP